MTAAGSRLELVWPGKDKFLLVPKDESGKPVWVERDHPAASEVRLTEGQRPLVQDLVRETEWMDQRLVVRQSIWAKLPVSRQVDVLVVDDNNRVRHVIPRSTKKPRQSRRTAGSNS